MHRGLLSIIIFLGAIQVVLLLYLRFSNDVDSGLVQRFDQAYRCDEQPTSDHLNSDGIIAYLQRPAKLDENCWHPVSLPENNPIQDAKVDIEHPHLRRSWYRVYYQPPVEAANTPLMAYIPRIIANAWEIRVNGQVIEDNRLDWRSTWNRPVGVKFHPKVDALDRRLTIDIGVIYSESEGFSMSRITVGDLTEIQRQKAFREYFQLIIPQAVTTVMFLFAGFLVSFWLARRNEVEYLILALAYLALMFQYMDFGLPQTDNSAQYAWTSTVIKDLPVPWISTLLYLFVARFFGFNYRWFESLLWLQLIIISLLTLSPIAQYHDISLLKGVVSSSFHLVAIAIYIRQAILTRYIGLWVITIITFLGIFGGVHDFCLVLNLIDPEQIYIGPFSVIVHSFAHLYVIQRRYVSAFTEQERLNSVLEQQLIEREALTRSLTEKEATLRSQQDRLLVFERAQALSQERQRLMHDIHDGLGSSLITTLAAVETHDLPRQDVAVALRDCIDDLRLVIDSLEPTANDLATLLGTIRYRLDQRLDKAGFELSWEINDIPELPWLEPSDALNILRLIQEALVNILKHASANKVQVSTHVRDQRVEIRIEDDGCGYDPDAIIFGRGLRSQSKRAQALGGELIIDTAPGEGATFRLILPVVKTSSQ